MIRYLEALSGIEECARARSLRYENVDIEHAVGRVLAEKVLSPEDVPSFTNSAMDGFAVFSSDTKLAKDSAPVRLPVRGLVAAGDGAALERAGQVRAGAAVEIMTGAPLPQGGQDAVVRIEDVEVSRSPAGDALWIEIRQPVAAGANVRLSATDFHVGQVIMRPGTVINPSHVLACASLGVAQVSVTRKPRVLVLSTGAELVSPREPRLPFGKIRNSTGPFLQCALKALGADCSYGGIIADDPRAYRQALERALADGVDVVVSTGAVSMGKYDFVKDVLTGMGARIHFHKAAIRPGKPILFAELGSGHRSCAFFGVPGNPVSTAVAQRFFIEPFIRAMMTLQREAPLRARLSAPMAKPPGLRCFYRGLAAAGDCAISVAALKSQASYVVSALVDANCWVVFPEDGTSAEVGTVVDVYPIQNAFDQGVFS